MSDGFDYILSKGAAVINWLKEKLGIGSAGASSAGSAGSNVLGAVGSTAASGGALSNLGAYGGIGAGVGLGLSGGIQWWKDMIGTWGDSDKSAGTKVLESIKHTLWDLSPIGALVNLGKKISVCGRRLPRCWSAVHRPRSRCRDGRLSGRSHSSCQQ